jgi:hypothetical protein
MAYTGITTRKTTCAICRVEIPTATLVYCDPTKRQGSHIAHVKCWDDLRASRAGKPQDKPKTKPTVQSHEPLDPPF